ncbi:hypothetical protein BD324DRAFT_297527 [Kockovaella imperatae]|uniref:Uncharacterized protein n=1 Tax=Kockovaella imperatae TaxID=4999 RepID=A0A1Y1ULI0_9TREE|nr:hypothetical protein BD324DRAFT_297527 [Kockovaella imperatae]ORX38908.1 hypothetical protein BD324DRAFT_297527 [Kockovaella imperatae]
MEVSICASFASYNPHRTDTHLDRLHSNPTTLAAMTRPEPFQRHPAFTNKRHWSLAFDYHETSPILADDRSVRPCYGLRQRNTRGAAPPRRRTVHKVLSSMLEGGDDVKEVATSPWTAQKPLDVGAQTSEEDFSELDAESKQEVEHEFCHCSDVQSLMSDDDALSLNISEVSSHTTSCEVIVARTLFYSVDENSYTSITPIYSRESKKTTKVKDFFWSSRMIIPRLRQTAKKVMNRFVAGRTGPEIAAGLPDLS